ncbi:MAG TPA: beta-ketoacyl synthase N-terminal-like domain-containing protein, partial [bacterium]|nr:beta-ketoacyl synthase N-terminal-like domain-containing protein [bacterium]
VDMAVVGGADMPLVASVLKGFANLGALSAQQARGAQASRPFDAARDGFVLGEGAGCLVLERASHAVGRGATPLARLLGGALTSEAHHLLAPREQGQAMADCMQRALRDAHVDPVQVAHVYSHGTGTHYNDQCEASALNGVLPHRPTVSASKAQLGHTLGAAGAVDAVLAAQSLGTGQVLPLAHLEQLDADCPIQPARQARDGGLENGQGVVLVNSFAFGGHNATLVLGAVRAWPGVRVIPAPGDAGSWP